MTKQTTPIEEHAQPYALAAQDQIEALEVSAPSRQPRIWWSASMQCYRCIAITDTFERVYGEGPTEEAAYAAWKVAYAAMAAHKALPWWHWKRWLA